MKKKKHKKIFKICIDIKDFILPINDKKPNLSILRPKISKIIYYSCQRMTNFYEFGGSIKGSQDRLDVNTFINESDAQSACCKHLLSTVIYGSLNTLSRKLLKFK